MQLSNNIYTEVYKHIAKSQLIKRRR